jgi:hypothetical protein
VSDRERDGTRWSGWLVPGAALLFAVALLVFTLGPRGEPAASPSPRPTVATPVPADEHEVMTDEGIVSFDLAGDEIVISLTTRGTTTELGRATLPFIATAPPGGTPVPTGTSAFVMVCRPVGTPTVRRYVFGHFDAGASVSYSGPEAVGHGASDGLFLFALLPDAPSGPVTVTARNGVMAGFGPGAFDDATGDGQRQPSGCFVLG